MRYALLLADAGEERVRLRRLGRMEDGNGAAPDAITFPSAKPTHWPSY